MLVALKNVLIVDTETTGLSPADGVCIEVGAILFNVQERAVVSQVSFLMPCLLNPAEDVNGINPSLTAAAPGHGPAVALLEQLLAQADAVVAHNADFDRQWFGLGVLPAVELPWICTMNDVRWPKVKKARPGVTAVALAYGVPVWAAHRALTDCIYLAQVFERCPDLEGLLQAAREPRVLYRAVVSYDDRQVVKDAGFSWNVDGRRMWTKKLSESEAVGLPFPVSRVD